MNEHERRDLRPAPRRLAPFILAALASAPLLSGPGVRGPAARAQNIFDGRGNPAPPRPPVRPPTTKPASPVVTPAAPAGAPAPAPAAPPPAEVIAEAPGEIPSAPAASRPARLAAPAAAEQAKALALTRKLFAEDYAKRSPADRRALARKLYQQAMDTSGDALGRYVLLRESKDVAAEAGDAAQAFRAVGVLGQEYLTDPLALRVEALQKAKSAALPEDYEFIAQSALEAADAAVAADDPDAGLKMTELASVFAGRARDNATYEQAVARRREIEVVKNEAAAYHKAQEVLGRKPADPEANTTVGRYLALIHGDWPQGLPYLAKGSDTALRSLGQAELAAPTKPEDQVALADKWYRLSPSQPEPFRARERERAKWWYTQAAATATGLLKATIQKQLAAIDASEGSARNKGVNLLALIDLQADAIAGKWAVREGALVCEPGHGARVAIPYVPPEEFDFVIEFAESQTPAPVVQILAGPKASCVWVIDLSAGGSSLGDVKGKPKASDVRLDAGSPAGQRHTSVVQVRRNAVRATVDGKLIEAYATDFSDLKIQPYWDLGGKGALGVGVEFGTAAFFRISVVEVSGKGRKLR